MAWRGVAWRGEARFLRARLGMETSSDMGGLWEHIRTQCSRPRCPNDASHQQLCDRHHAEARALRPNATHLRWRRAVLDRSPWCEDPLGNHKGRMVPATEAHHVRPPASFAPWDQARAWVLGNGMGLCQRCHLRLSRDVVTL